MNQWTQLNIATTEREVVNPVERMLRESHCDTAFFFFIFFFFLYRDAEIRVATKSESTCPPISQEKTRYSK